MQKFLRGKIINVTEVNQQRWLEESGQWLINVDRTHLVLASGKPVLPKNWINPGPTRCNSNSLHCNNCVYFSVEWPQSGVRRRLRQLPVFRPAEPRDDEVGPGWCGSDQVLPGPSRELLLGQGRSVRNDGWYRSRIRIEYKPYSRLTEVSRDELLYLKRAACWWLRAE